MIQIIDHKELALEDCIPYLLQFPEVYSLIEQSGDRYQIIEDIAWELLLNLDYNYAQGTWLDYIGRKVGQDRYYSPVPIDAFTFGGTRAEGFGAGKLQAGTSLSATKKSRSDTSFRNAIRAKIITNNTNATLESLKNSCKLLYNAKLVSIKEQFPAGIEKIGLYGSTLLQDLNATNTVDTMLGAGISVNQVVFYNMFNLFKNNAFISYDSVVPSDNDFELSLTVKLDTLSQTENTAILSQGSNWSDPTAPIRLYYDVENGEGIVFRTTPNQYNDNYTGNTTYNDGESNIYVDSEGAVYLSGGTLYENDDIDIKITKVGTTWSLYVNQLLVDQEESDARILFSEQSKIYLGASNSKYYNSGSIYNLFLKDLTDNKIIINDPLKTNTIGNNNGVIWI